MNKTFMAAIATVLVAKFAEEKPLSRCASSRDGDCSHKQCPQLRDGEPAKTGRHCPLNTYTNED